MPDLNDITKESTQSLKNTSDQMASTGLRIGRAAGKAGRAIKKGAAKGTAAVGKKVMQALAGLIKIIGAIVASAPIIIAIVLVAAIFLGLAYTWFMGDRGTSQDRTLSAGSENPLYIDSETGSLTSDVLTEPQAVMDAYYKWMACQSYTKEYAYKKDDGSYETIDVNFRDDAEDFAGLSDYNGEEGSYYLSPDLIMMADEVLHKGEFRWPEHIVSPVNHTLSEYTNADGDTRMVVETQSLRNDMGQVDKNLVRQTGLGSVVLYEPGVKDDYVSAKVTSFQMDFDKATVTGPIGDPSYTHITIETFTVSDTDTYATIIERINSKVSSLKDTYCHNSNESIVYHGLSDAMLQFFFNGGKLTRTENSVDTEYTIDHMPQAVIGKDAEIDKTGFNNDKLDEVFGNDCNGLYPITIPNVTSVATMSGNIRYTYLDEAQGDSLQEGSSSSIYDPVDKYTYDCGCKGSLTGDARTLTAQKSGVHYTSFPVAITKNPDPDRPEETREERDIDIGNPWGYQYFDDYAANYSGDVPQSAYDDPNFFDRLQDEDTLAMLKELGLLVEKTDGALGAVGSYAASDLELLARVIRQEAGSNKLDELLVASVVMNRVASNLFPNTLIDVINQPGQYASATKLYDADPSDSDWDSARQVLSGEFAIPSNVLYQSGNRNNGDALWLENVNSATGASSEATHYYCWQGGGSVSNVDRFGRTALSVAQARELAQQLASKPTVGAPSAVEGSGGAGPVETGPTETGSVAGMVEGESYYAVTPFNVLAATNTLRKITEPEDSFSGPFAGLFHSAAEFFAGLTDRFFAFNALSDPADTSAVTTRYDYTPKEIDQRRIIYQAVTFRDNLNYRDVQEEWQNKSDVFLFIGDKVYTSQISIVSEVGSILPGWVSPTGIPSTPASVEAGPTGKGALMVTLEGEPVQALYDGTVITVDGDTITIRYDTVDGMTYTSTYRGLSEVLVTVGTPVHARDLVGKAGSYDGTQGFLFEFHCQNTGEELLPMTMFYQVVYAGGGSDLVSLALSEAAAYRANPMGYDKLKYERWMHNGHASGEAWCADFASWCYGQCYGSPPQPKSPSCTELLRQSREAGVFYPSQAHGGSYIPQPGDLILYRWDGATKPASHVGIVIGVEGDQVITVEGNTNKPNDVPIVVNSTGVWRKTHNLSFNCILGYCNWPSILAPVSAS